LLPLIVHQIVSSSAVSTVMSLVTVILHVSLYVSAAFSSFELDTDTSEAADTVRLNAGIIVMIITALNKIENNLFFLINSTSIEIRIITPKY